jgi:hypothetical protein
VYGSRIVSGLAAVFAGMTALFFVLSFVYSLVFLPVAAMFGLATYFVWYHASGRFASRLYRGIESQAAPEGGGVGAGPREEWAPPRDGERARAQADGRGRARPGDGVGPGDERVRGGGGPRGARARQRARRPPESDGPTAREAYETLGLEPDADDGAVTDAYRRKVKETHPDRPTGDEEEFKRVQAAYERLTE